jgi:hypothetical protein
MIKNNYAENMKKIMGASTNGSHLEFACYIRQTILPILIKEPLSDIPLNLLSLHSALTEKCKRTC